MWGLNKLMLLSNREIPILNVILLTIDRDQICLRVGWGDSKIVVNHGAKCPFVIAPGTMINGVYFLHIIMAD